METEYYKTKESVEEYIQLCEGDEPSIVIPQFLSFLDSNSQILEIGSGVGIVKSYKYLVQGHEELIKEVNGFIPPEKSEEYIRSFKKGMGGLVAPIEKQAKDFRKAAVKKIETENILSSDNSWFIGNMDLPFSPEYFVDKHGVLMDKGGAR